jgi:hypothetical protein
MFLFWAVAFINVMFLSNFFVLPYIAWFLFLNFSIAIFINPKFAPINAFSRFLVKKKKKNYIWALQKRFAWFLWFLLTWSVFILSFYLLEDEWYFPIVCLLCLICLFLIAMEAFFKICVGCDIYRFLLEKKIIKEPKVRPKCSWGRCDIKK